jgi:hypothetical protein
MQFVLLVLIIIVAFGVLGFILKTLWWIAVIAGGIVLGGAILRALDRN